jgi:hypothetical protein
MARGGQMTMIRMIDAGMDEAVVARIDTRLAEMTNSVTV